ncbi:hypothetical protein WR25_19372 [Diploscapter pachys]|uniref:Uncharacterized protein n=1 Tax=Diploscapter pachys TaxID=2018661 RepID=A0A2A2KEX0_9BILA|nr:hypothetical protein WR25_19372 [Diploscapter pachys]
MFEDKICISSQVIIDWGPAMLHAREGSIDYRMDFDPMARFTEHMEHIGSPMAYQWENKCNGSISAPPPGIVPAVQSSSPTFLPPSTVHGNLSGSMGTIGSQLFPLPNQPRTSLTPSTPRSSHPNAPSLPLATNHIGLQKSYESLSRSSPIPRKASGPNGGENGHFAARLTREADSLFYSHYNSIGNHNQMHSVDKRRISVPARYTNTHLSHPHHLNSPRASIHSAYFPSACNQHTSRVVSPANSVCSVS